jgi:hypothetical protein
MDLINLNIYAPIALISYGSCAAIWFGIYLYLLYRVRKTKFSEVPIIAFSGFIAWEVLWGYHFRTDMGALAFYGLKVFAPVSIYIGWEVFRSGHQQLFTRTVQKQVPLLMGFSLVVWTTALYYFIPAVDDGAGLTTATLLTMIYSAFALHLMLKLFEHEGAAGLSKLSFGVGCARVVANICGGTFCYLHLLHVGDRRWLLVLAAATTAMDVAYVFIFQKLRATATEPAAQPASVQATV